MGTQAKILTQPVRRLDSTGLTRLTPPRAHHSLRGVPTTRPSSSTPAALHLGMRSRGSSNPPTPQRRPSFSEHIRVSIRRSLSGGSNSNINTMATSNAIKDMYLRCNLCLRRISFCHYNRGGGGGRKSSPLILVLCLTILLVFVRLGPSGFSSSSSLRRGGSNNINSKVLRMVGKNTRVSSDDLAAFNTELSEMELDDVLRWAYNTFGDRLVDVTSFGYSGMVVLYKLHQLGLLRDVPVVTIDTLHLFPETYDFIDNVKYHQFKIANFYKYTPKDYEQRQGFDDAYGVDLWKAEPDRYNYLSKVEPTMRALDELDAAAWITGRRRDQGGERKDLQILEVDSSDKTRYKLNPLANWSYEDIWSFIHSHGVPYNPLHDKGYKSVGDYMTTAPVDKGAAERSGRFVGLGRTECGIHSTRKKIKRMRQEAEKTGRDFEGTMTLPCPDCNYEVTPETFDEIVLQGSNDGKMLLLEFYSPLCGGCQEFAPKFKKIVKSLKGAEDKIEIARYDITDHDVPQSGQDLGMMIEATPDLYLVRHDDSLQVIRYDGEHEVTPVKEWISSQTGLSI